MARPRKTTPKTKKIADYFMPISLVSYARATCRMVDRDRANECGACRFNDTHRWNGNPTPAEKVHALLGIGGPFGPLREAHLALRLAQVAARKWRDYNDERRALLELERLLAVERLGKILIDGYLSNQGTAAEFVSMRGGGDKDSQLTLQWRTLRALLLLKVPS